MRGSGKGALLLALVAAGAAAGAPHAAAQGVRGSAQTVVRYFELRPILQDTVSRSRVTPAADSSFTFEGFPAYCVAAESCIYYRPRDVDHQVAATQDVSFTAWGLGVQGLSGTVQVRGRANSGRDFVTPRPRDNHFDAVLAYLELNRAGYRLRAGRQQLLSGLGTTAFDGLDALWEPRAGLRLQAFAGRGLTPGLNEPRSEVLRGVEDYFFLSDDLTLLVGGQLAYQPRAREGLTLRYQREAFANRSGLLTERASLSGHSARLRPVLLSGEADYDVAFGRVGKAHLRAQVPLPRQRATLEVTARRYLPYFELWTIWGYFSPVAYREGELRASWAPSSALNLWASAGYRAYDETDAPIIVEPLRDEAGRGGVGGHWALSERLAVNGAYTVEGPAGAFVSSGQTTLTWQHSQRLALSLHGLAFQQIEEYRAGNQVVFGGGGSVDAELNERTRLSGGLDLYRQSIDNRPETPDWNQTRGWLMLQVEFGRDPGFARGDGR